MPLINDFAEMTLMSYRSNPPLKINDVWERLGNPFVPEAIVGPLQFPYDHQIVAYRNIKENIIVMAHRGTVPTSLSNWIRDDGKEIVFNQFGKEIPNYVCFSESVRNQLHQQYPHYQIAHTGHSLGGATASIVANINNDMAIVFDTPGVQQIIDRIPELNRRVDAQLPQSKIYLVLSTPNVVNSFGIHLRNAEKMRVNPLPPADHEQRYIDSISDMPQTVPITLLGGLPNPFQGHSMMGIAKYLKTQGKQINLPEISVSSNPILDLKTLPIMPPSIPPIIKPPPQSTQEFLQTHTLEEKPTQSQPNFFQSVISGFFGNMLTGLAGSFFSSGSKQKPALLPEPRVSAPTVSPTPPAPAVTPPVPTTPLFQQPKPQRIRPPQKTTTISISPSVLH